MTHHADHGCGHGDSSDDTPSWAEGPEPEGSETTQVPATKAAGPAPDSLLVRTKAPPARVWQNIDRQLREEGLIR